MEDIETLQIPFFEELEKEKFINFSKNQKISDLGKIVLIINDAHLIGEEIERISSAFLTSNLLLMQKSSRKVIKSVVLKTSHDQRNSMYPIVNSFRYYLCGEYSRLDNYKNWNKVAIKDGVLNEELSNATNDIFNFLTSSKIFASNTGRQKAETMLGISFDGDKINQGFDVDFQPPFLVHFTADDQKSTEILSQSRFMDGFSVAVSYSRDAILMELDGNNISNGLDNWGACVNSLFQTDMLGTFL